MLAILGKLGRVDSLIVRKLLQTGSIQLDRENMPLPRIVFVGGEKYGTGRFVHALYPQHFEVALRELPLQLCIGGKRVPLVKAVEVEVDIPVAPARPQESATGVQKTNLHMVEI